MNDEIRNGYQQADWQKHYDSDDLTWDLGHVAPPFVRLFEEKTISPGKLIVPGCGQGHEVIFFARRGFQVTGVDFTSGAVSRLRGSLDRHQLEARVLHQNFFDLDDSHRQAYDCLLEHTFFCAIHPRERPAYVDTVCRILKNQGVLAGLFYETGEEGGPPFNTTENHIRNCFSNGFDIERLEKCSFSDEKRAGKEWLAVMRKK